MHQSKRRRYPVTQHKYGRKKLYRIRKKKSVFLSPFLWISVLAIILLGGLIYLFFLADFFQVKEVNINGNQKIASEDINRIVNGEVNKKLLIFNTKSIFIARSQSITKSILNNYPMVESVKISKDLPSSIAIEIKERSPIAIFCKDQSENCFYIDKSGMVFEQKNIADSNSILVVEPKNEIKDINIGQTIMSQEKTDTILKIVGEIQDKFHIPVSRVVMENSSDGLLENDSLLDIETKEGWKIQFDLANNVDWQLIKLNAVLEKQIPAEKRGDLEYIDLKIGNFAPYKYRDNNTSLPLTE